jgi:hypothetical protein
MSAHTDNERSEAAVDVPRLVRHLDDFRRTAAEQRKTAKMQKKRYGTGNSIYCEATAMAATLEEVCSCIESCLPNNSYAQKNETSSPAA